MPATSVSLVIPSHQRAHSLARTLASLDRVHIPPGGSLQVVVVLDGCSDDSDAVARRWGNGSAHRLTLLEQPGSGPAAARNAGIAASDGEYVGFIDDDVVPDTHWLEAHLAAQATGDGTQPCVTLGAMRLPEHERLPPWNEWEVLSLRTRYAALAAGTAVAGPDDLYTANAMVPRAALQRVGGFDVSLRRAEDVELGRRLQADGARFHFCKNASVVHFPRRTFENWRAIPVAYAKAHVQMSTLHGHEHDAASYRARLVDMHVLTRQAVGLFETRPRGASLFCAFSAGVGSLASRLGMRRVSHAAYSAIYNVSYFSSLHRERRASEDT